MHLGYLSFGGTELANSERLQAYVDNGLIPDGVTVEACEDCEGLAEAITGVGFADYRTPILDAADWFDPDDPDTWDFAGILPLEVTGADSSVALVEVVPTLGDGGVAGSRHRGPRTLAVTAILLGRTAEGVEAGRAWLERVLYGGCDEGDCPGTADVTMFTVCPGPLVPSFDPTADPLLFASSVATDDWLACDGDMLPTEECLEFYPYSSDVIDANDPDGPWEEEEVDGADADGPWDGELIDGGDPGLIPGDEVGTLAGLIGSHDTYVGGPLTIEWSMAQLATATGDISVQLVIVNPTNCEVLVYGPVVALDADDAEDPQLYSWSIPDGVIDPEWTWAPAILTETALCVEHVHGLWQPLLDGESCIAPYRRTFPLATVVAGPTVVETITMDDGTQFVKVEWTWQTGSPYRLGTERVLVENLRNVDDSIPDYTDPQVEVGHMSGDPTNAPASCPPPSPIASDCADDPGYPSWVAPPALPTVTDPDRIVVGTDDVDRVWLNIPPAVTPTGEGVLKIELHSPGALHPKVGVRIRVYVTDANDPSELDGDACDFEYEYHIDYIPGGGILTIDGRTGRITTLCDGDTLPVDSSNLVRGNYGGPVVQPVIKCDQRYMVVVDHLSEYPRTVPGVYNSGADQDVLGVHVSLSLREG